MLDFLEEQGGAASLTEIRFYLDPGRDSGRPSTPTIRAVRELERCGLLVLLRAVPTGPADPTSAAGEAAPLTRAKLTESGRSAQREYDDFLKRLRHGKLLRLLERAGGATTARTMAVCDGNRRDSSITTRNLREMEGEGLLVFESLPSGWCRLPLLGGRLASPLVSLTPAGRDRLVS